MFSLVDAAPALSNIADGIEPFVSSIGLTATLILIILLIIKELAAAALENRPVADSPEIVRVCRVLNIGIIPCLLTFGLVIFTRVISVL
ncbi:MAG: hypothetical protein PHP51_03980 [Desulfotomaculaceae bacterium]|nr:hypothetical protein [Desulfotomaculaceae bacterium]MDD4766347.1 hypothetical protein [Desulfotomaculaceae bacterium]